jgi:hypothetical protein
LEVDFLIIAAWRSQVKSFKIRPLDGNTNKTRRNSFFHFLEKKKKSKRVKKTNDQLVAPG